MDCRAFDEIVCELADGSQLDAMVRKSGLAHALACEHCADRLANERALKAELNALAQRTAVVQIPTQLGQSLNAAFAQHFEPRKASVLANVGPLKTRETFWLWQWLGKEMDWGWGLAAAALLLLMGGLMIYGRLASTPRQQEVIATVAPTPAAIAATADAIDSPLQTALAQPQPKSTQASVPRRRMPVRKVTENETSAENAAFIPLTSDTDGREVNGIVVRMEIERAALLAYGLPLSVQRAGEKVAADVLLGDDGAALAIRLVK